MSQCKISERLIELRTSKGITQAQLAEQLLVSDKVISKWENATSMPDLNMLIALADFYNVSTDNLLGIVKNEKQSTKTIIKKEFSELKFDYSQAIIKAFEITRAIIPVMSKYGACPLNEDVMTIYPQEYAEFTRSLHSSNYFYNFIANSDNANFAVMLLRNKNNFSWMKDEKIQEKIVGLFTLLADADALSVIYFIHSTSCSKCFTADYISKNTGVGEEKVTEILEASTKYELCVKSTAHLVSGEIAVYESAGNGNILSLITLAYEHICGKKAYDYNSSYGCKMIDTRNEV